MQLNTKWLLLITAPFLFTLNRAQVANNPTNPGTVRRASVFKINIDRKIKGENCTQGYIAVNGKVMGYTLELPDKNNKAYISSIPKGTYSATIRVDGTKGWRIELQQVPNRENIQIHVGNYTRDIIGCILLGEGVDVENCSVTKSAKSMKALQDEFNKYTVDLVLNQANTQAIEIEVEISGI